MSLPRGLYAITPDWSDTARLLRAVAAAFKGGASVLQYRNKQADAALRHEQALALRDLCRQHGKPLIINDHLELALTIEADGLHLGADDGALTLARQALGPSKLLGASCYQQLDLAKAAIAEGACHIAFGAVYPSTSKPHAQAASLSLFAESAHLQVPRVAIGGILPQHVHSLHAAGVDTIAVISGLFDAPDIEAAAAALSAPWHTQRLPE